MKKIIFIVFASLSLSLSLFSQTLDVRERVFANPELASGCNYMLNFDVPPQTKAPRGYKAFYISHYGRHGARYYWGDGLYYDMMEILTAASEAEALTPLGEHIWEQYRENFEDLRVHATDLSSKGWDQHKEIARRMYKDYPSIFRHRPKIQAASSHVGRCLMSMASFCLSLKEQNPRLDVRESAGREYYPSIMPMDSGNPWPERYESYPFAWDGDPDPDFGGGSVDFDAIVSRVFCDLGFMQDRWTSRKVAYDLWNLYANTPCSDVEMDLDGIFTTEEKYFFFVGDCRMFHYDCGRNRYQFIPLLRDYLARADAAVASGKPAVDLRFGHDGILMAFVILLNIDHFGDCLTSPDQIVTHCPLYRIPMGSNLQLVFYHKRFNRPGDVLVKLLLNGEEVSLPFPAAQGPYYRWDDFKEYYSNFIAAHPALATTEE